MREALASAAPHAAPAFELRIYAVRQLDPASTVDVLVQPDLAEQLPILQDNIAPEARILTDEAGYYSGLSKEFKEHRYVSHGKGEYVSKADRTVHTNTIEGFFSVFKRGMKGVYQHCGHNHLQRYVAEFDFRYNTRKALGVEDSQRADQILRGVQGKRLTYETTAG